MFKLAIIDDEKFIVKGLEILIDWQKLGIDVVCATTKVDEIIEKCETFDFLLTDVQMPKMTGIELVSKVKAKNPQLECIILSGYDDFQYAQRGMQVGVSNYLLKPVDEEEITRTFEKIVEKMAEKKQEQKIIQQQVYQQLLDNPQSIELSALISDENRNQPYYLFIARERTTFEGADLKITWLFEQPKSIGVCWVDSKEAEMAAQQLSFSGAQVISPLAYTRDDFYSCFENLHDIVVFDEAKTIVWEEFESQTLDFGQALEQINNFQNLLIQEDLTRPSAIIMSELTERYTKPDFDNLVLLYVLALQQFAVNQSLIFDKGNNKTAPQILDELTKLTTGKAVVEQVCKWCQDLQMQYHKKITSYTPIIRRVMVIIEQEYGQDLSLKTLSHKLNMNASYLGQIFKDEVGTSFNYYINKLRMEKAQELLLDSNMKINQIAQQVGFQDNSYFYRKFKSYYGYCPNTVRKSK